MRNLYIQFREKGSGWKEKICFFFNPILFKNMESDFDLDRTEIIAQIPKWKKKEKMINRIQEIKEKEKIDQLIFTEEVAEYLGEYAQKEKEQLHKKMQKAFLEEELEYIITSQKKNSQNLDLYFLVNEYSKEMKEILTFFSQRYKVIHILSKNQTYYTRWIERMEEIEESNYIYSRNYRKSLAKAKIILNFDFTMQELKKFKLNPNAIVFQLTEEKISFPQIFNGVVITGARIEADEQKLGIYTELKGFSLEEIYSARLDKNLNYEEVIRKIKKDHVKVKYLKGINGKIDEREYKCLTVS